MSRSTETVWLRRTDSSVPWGLRLGGGAQAARPLRVIQMSADGAAFSRLSEGDILTKIGHIPAQSLTLQAAEELIRRSGDFLQLQILRTTGDDSVQGSTEHVYAASKRNADGDNVYIESPSGDSGVYRIGSPTAELVSLMSGMPCRDDRLNPMQSPSHSPNVDVFRSSSKSVRFSEFTEVSILGQHVIRPPSNTNIVPKSILRKSRRRRRNLSSTTVDTNDNEIGTMKQVTNVYRDEPKTIHINDPFSTRAGSISPVHKPPSRVLSPLTINMAQQPAIVEVPQKMLQTDELPRSDILVRRSPSPLPGITTRRPLSPTKLSVVVFNPAANSAAQSSADRHPLTYVEQSAAALQQLNTSPDSPQFIEVSPTSHDSTDSTFPFNNDLRLGGAAVGRQGSGATVNVSFGQQETTHTRIPPTNRNSAPQIVRIQSAPKESTTPVFHEAFRVATDTMQNAANPLPPLMVANSPVGSTSGMSSPLADSSTNAGTDISLQATSSRGTHQLAIDNDSTSIVIYNNANPNRDANVRSYHYNIDQQAHGSRHGNEMMNSSLSPPSPVTNQHSPVYHRQSSTDSQARHRSTRVVSPTKHLYLENSIERPTSPTKHPYLANSIERTSSPTKHLYLENPMGRPVSPTRQRKEIAHVPVQVINDSMAKQHQFNSPTPPTQNVHQPLTNRGPMHPTGPHNILTNNFPGPHVRSPVHSPVTPFPRGSIAQQPFMANNPPNVIDSRQCEPGPGYSNEHLTQPLMRDGNSYGNVPTNVQQSFQPFNNELDGSFSSNIDSSNSNQSDLYTQSFPTRLAQQLKEMEQKDHLPIPFDYSASPPTLTSQSQRLPAAPKPVHPAVSRRPQPQVYRKNQRAIDVASENLSSALYDVTRGAAEVSSSMQRHKRSLSIQLLQPEDWSEQSNQKEGGRRFGRLHQHLQAYTHHPSQAEPSSILQDSSAELVAEPRVATARQDERRDVEARLMNDSSRPRLGYYHLPGPDRLNVESSFGETEH